LLRKAKTWLTTCTLLFALASPMMPTAAAQRDRHNDRRRYYSGMRNGVRDPHYDQLYRPYENNGDRNRYSGYNNGYYQNQGGGIGPGYGALIGAGGGAVLGALFGGGLKGAIIGGAAGAGLGALGGKLAQGDNNNDNYYNNYRGQRRH
jgi:hypothetical protein